MRSLWIQGSNNAVFMASKIPKEAGQNVHSVVPFSDASLQGMVWPYSRIGRQKTPSSCFSSKGEVSWSRKAGSEAPKLKQNKTGNDT